MASSIKLRQVWLWLHWALGLSVGLVLALVGLTGALLIFVEPLAKWENGDILFPENIPPFEITPQKVDIWLKTVADDPNFSHVEVEGIEYPNAGHIPGTVPILFAHDKNETGGEIHVVTAIHPVTDEILGRFVVEKSFWIKLVFFHVSLLLPFGGEMVSWATLLGFFSLLSGVILWWPRKNWKKAFTVSRSLKSRRDWLSWRNSVALSLLVPMIVLLYTGLAVVKPNWVDPVWKTVFPIREYTPVPASQNSGMESDRQEGEAPSGEKDPREISVSQAVAVALQANPGLVVRTIFPANDFQKDVHFIGLMPPGADPRAQHTEVWVNTHTAEIMMERPGEQLNFAEWVKSTLIPLHADLNLGIIGQGLVFGGGMSLPLLFVSGFVLWRWEKARTRRSEPGPTHVTTQRLGSL